LIANVLLQKRPVTTGALAVFPLYLGDLYRRHYLCLIIRMALVTFIFTLHNSQTDLTHSVMDTVTDLSEGHN